mgnify:CR=1 FL=1
MGVFLSAGSATFSTVRMFLTVWSAASLVGTSPRRRGCQGIPAR